MPIHEIAQEDFTPSPRAGELTSRELSRFRTFANAAAAATIAMGQRWAVWGIQVEYKFRIKYRHPRTGAAGIAILYTAAELAAEQARLEALGYVVTEVLLPIGERPRPTQ
jgi:hypothetical protein